MPAKEKDLARQLRKCSLSGMPDKEEINYFAYFSMPDKENSPFLACQIRRILRPIRDISLSGMPDKENSRYLECQMGNISLSGMPDKENSPYLACQMR